MPGVDRRSIVLVLALTVALPAVPQTSQADRTTADRLFKAGKFPEARKIYAKIAQQDPKDFTAAHQLGHIALLSNQLSDAQSWLEKALRLEPGDADAKVMLAETLYRLNRFPEAASSLAGLSPTDQGKLKSYSTLNVAKLESFKGQTPYELHGSGESTSVKFLKTDPLPLVQVHVNGGPEAVFFLDTGGSELLLDADFARELGVKSLGSVQGTFSGGQHAQVQNGRVESLTLGDWTLKNVPVGMLSLRLLSDAFGIKQLDGCIGTNVLYQFLSTIDYPGGQLILRRKTADNLKQFETSAMGKSVIIPMWMAGDHFMVAWGQVERLPPALMFIDTGLAGAAVKLADSVIQRAGIKLESTKATEGQGGGGRFKTIPYSLDQFSLGGIEQKKLLGLYDGPFPWGSVWGFRVAGMVGHDFFKHYAVTFDFTGMRIIVR